MNQLTTSLRSCHCIFTSGPLHNATHALASSATQAYPTCHVHLIIQTAIATSFNIHSKCISHFSLYSVQVLNKFPLVSLCEPLLVSSICLPFGARACKELNLAVPKYILAIWKQVAMVSPSSTIGLPSTNYLCQGSASFPIRHGTQHSCEPSKLHSEET
jgi:hypothetical protein